MYAREDIRSLVLRSSLRATRTHNQVMFLTPQPVIINESLSHMSATFSVANPNNDYLMISVV